MAATTEEKRSYKRQWYAANSEWCKQRDAAYRRDNPEKYAAQLARKREKQNAKRLNPVARPELLARESALREQHRERNRAAARAHWRKNKNKNASRYTTDKYREYRRAYAKRRRDLWDSQAAKRRSAKINATPLWFEEQKIKELYAAATVLSEISNASYHVDHIVPLVSKRVCGLHCLANLQVILGTENTSKQNRYWPDMP